MNNNNNSKHRILIFGSSGWIGSKIIELIKTNQDKQYDNICIFESKARIQNRESVERDIGIFKPDSIINCAGVTGRPNVDWCEDHQIETIRSNVIGTLTLIDVAYEKGIHVTNFGTGCIYNYDDDHKPFGNETFKETDPVNYTGSFYSKTKAIVEDLTSSYKNLLMLRIRMPISGSIKEQRNFITKILNYEKVVNVPNSVSVLEDLLPISIDMTIKGIKGVFNMCNPGVVCHNEILELYKKEIDPSYTYQNFSLEEQAKILKAGRCNNHLDVSKLLSLYPQIPTIQDSLIDIFRKIRHQQQHQEIVNINE
ncbi:3,5-epimerase/4-reductase [Cavenderia fasciculata]|uniref:3,5-epimerase/4-reductase n=1 Tax=Cavenderia fasciculata TaxID=261658 RepID=F4QDZ0_CACFS|nr:3,5-epimerase/4-reductase [Cavenderia fasciculata]EGG13937.1 3,5-epimerase/4-reductase [Cavenderia fasciculata]|eukprot:XP_004350645.1 3,5-epimerase/4-reductase [Cavenderia fasciculata]